MEGEFAYAGKGEAALARCLAKRRLFYKKIGEWYFPLADSTITTYLRNIKKQMIDDLAKEKRQRKANEKGKKSPRKS